MVARRESEPPRPAATPGTRTEEHRGRAPRLPAVRRFRLSVAEGAEARAWESSGDRCSIGSDPSNDLAIDDATVSRFHCEIVAGDEGVTVRDLDSRNGTVVDGVLVREAFLRSGSLLLLGRVGLRFQVGNEKNPRPLSERTSLGSLVGVSVAMRGVFALLEKVAASDVTVLLGGETGTGKGAAAESIHAESARSKGPFVVVDCSAMPATLLDAELFGHERGAFTGADQKRVGAFEEADGGTLFLDEIGELPLDLQPKLLRALEERTVRRLGSNAHHRIDVRLIAATHRELRREVNEKRFRADMYYRLSVARITMPPLRERPDDIPVLIERMLDQRSTPSSAREALLAPESLARLTAAAWPGNIRELRNHVERALVFQQPLEESLPLPGDAESWPVDIEVPLIEARKLAVDDLERRYLLALMAACENRTVQAATKAGIDRVYLYRLLRRHGLR